MAELELQITVALVLTAAYAALPGEIGAIVVLLPALWGALNGWQWTTCEAMMRSAWVVWIIVSPVYVIISESMRHGK